MYLKKTLSPSKYRLPKGLMCLCQSQLLGPCRQARKSRRFNIPLGVHDNLVFRTWCKYRRIYSYDMLRIWVKLEKTQDIPAKISHKRHSRLLGSAYWSCIIFYLFNDLFLFGFLFPFSYNYFFFEGVFLFVGCLVFVCLFVRFCCCFLFLFFGFFFLG